MIFRNAESADAMAVARVHVRSWRTAYHGLMPDEYLAALNPEDRAARYDFASFDPAKPHTIVASEGLSVVGFVTAMPSMTTGRTGVGEICALYVDPDMWGRGIGVGLISSGRRYLSELGFKAAELWVLEGNTRAIRFYEMDGWKPDGASRTVTVWGLTVNESRYCRTLDESGPF